MQYTLGEAGPKYNVEVGIEDTLSEGNYTDTQEVIDKQDTILGPSDYTSSRYDWTSAGTSKLVKSAGGLMQTITSLVNPKASPVASNEKKGMSSTPLIIGGVAVAAVLAVILISKT